MKRAVLQTKENGESSWLTVIPIQEHGFAVTKSSNSIQINNYKECLVNVPAVKNTI